MTTRTQTATMNNRTDFAAYGSGHSALEALVASAVGHFTLLSAWNERARQRHHLSQLDDRMLADIGVSRPAAAYEAAKKPWQD